MQEQLPKEERSKRIKKLLQDVGLKNIAELSLKMGIAQVTCYQHIARGITDIRTIRQYAAALKIPFLEAVELMSIADYGAAPIAECKRALKLSESLCIAYIHQAAKNIRDLIDSPEITKHKEIKQLILKHVCNIYQSDL